MELKDYLALPYTVELRRDEDGDWIARIKELSGCTADGPTREEALQDLDTAHREWIAAAIEDGIAVPMPEPKTKLPSGKWLQRAPRFVHQALKHLAALEGTSFNAYVASVLANHVGYASSRYATTTAMLRPPQAMWGVLCGQAGQVNMTTTVMLSGGGTFVAMAGYASTSVAFPSSRNNFALEYMRVPDQEFSMMTGANRG